MQKSRSKKSLDLEKEISRSYSRQSSIKLYTFAFKLNDIRSELYLLQNDSGDVRMFEFLLDIKHDIVENATPPKQYFLKIKDMKDQITDEISNKRALLSKIHLEEAVNIVLDDIQQSITRANILKHKYLGVLREEKKVARNDERLSASINEHLRELSDEFDRLLASFENQELVIRESLENDTTKDVLPGYFDHKLDGLDKQFNNMLMQLEVKHLDSLRSKPPLVAKHIESKIEPPAPVDVKNSFNVLKSHAEDKSKSQPELIDNTREKLADKPASQISQELYKLDSKIKSSKQKLHMLQEKRASITTAPEKINTAIQYKEKELARTKSSIEKLDLQIQDINAKIEQLVAEKEMAELELNKKKDEFQTGLRSVTELNKLLFDIMRKIQEAETSFGNELTKLAKEKEIIKKRTDLTESSRERLLKEIEEKEKKVKSDHEKLMIDLENEKREKEAEAQRRVSNLNEEIDHFVAAHQEILADLEKQLLEAKTQSEADLIRQKIEALKSQFEKDLKNFRALGGKDLKAMTSLERIAALYGLEKTASGRLRTASGNVYTFQEALDKGIIDACVYTTASGTIIGPDGKIYNTLSANQNDLLGGELKFSDSGRTLNAIGEDISRDMAERDYGTKIRSVIKTPDGYAIVRDDRFKFFSTDRLLTAEGNMLTNYQLGRLGLLDLNYKDGYFYTPSGHKLTKAELLSSGLLKLTDSGYVIRGRGKKGAETLRYTASGNLLLGDGMKISRSEALRRGIINKDPCLFDRVLKITASGNVLLPDGTKLTRDEAERLGLLENALKLIPQRLVELPDGSRMSRGEALDRGYLVFPLKWTPSGNVLLPDGTKISKQQAKEWGLLDFLPDDHSEDDTLSDASSAKMSVQDTQYLKDTVGHPLILALADVTTRKPTDPIHYLAHWLFRYRYNREMSKRRKEEIEELIKERERLAAENLHTVLLDEAKHCINTLLENLPEYGEQTGEEDAEEYDAFSDQMKING